MDHNITKKIQDWLNRPKQERNLHEGALLLLQLSGNQILFRNITLNPAKYADHIEYQLNKYLKFRLAALTHEQVEEMQRKVETIVKKDHLEVKKHTKAQKAAAAEESKKKEQLDN